MDRKYIHIDLSKQKLLLFDGAFLENTYDISSALNGPGNQMNSGCTPLGKHYIRAKIGEDLPINSVFIARRPTGETYNDQLAKANPDRDWILTRILWLCGQERGINRLGDVDTMRRYIYIHGTPDSEPMGTPLSHGCIRMRNMDIIELFGRVEVYTPVIISNHT